MKNFHADNRMPSTTLLPFAAAVVALVLSACGSGAASLAATPSPRPASTLTAAPIETAPPASAPETPSPAGAADLANLTCRLPVSQGTPLPGAAATAAGFVSFPAGTFSADPGGSKAYDAAHDRWLPVPPAAVAPDGSSYAYLETQSGVPGTPLAASLHVVDAATRNDRRVWSTGGFGAVSGFSSRGVLVTVYSSNGPDAALWLVSTDGTTRRLSTIYATWVLGAGDVAWGVTRDTGPKQATPAPTQLLRLDLVNGSTTSWLDDLGGGAVVGIDAAGNPLVGRVRDATGPGQGQIELVVVSRPGKKSPFGIVDLRAMNMATAPFLDRHGLWFADTQGGIWLLQPGGTPRQVATVPVPNQPTSQTTSDPSTAQGPTVPTSIAGPCV